MKEITGKIKQKKNNNFPKELKISKRSLHSSEQIANEFKSFFTNIGPSLAKNIAEYLMSFNDAISDSDLTTEEFETDF